MSADPGFRQLSQPIAEASPCGEDLEEAQLLAPLDALRLFGQAISLDPAPPWGEIKQKSLDALRRSLDLRALAHLAAATIRTDGLAAFMDLLGIAAIWLESYWEQLYPRVDEDAVLRRSALSCFADPFAVVDGLRRAALITHPRLGAVSLRDIDIAAGQVTPADGESQRRPQSQIDAIFSSSPLAQLTALRSMIDDALAAVRRIESAMVSRSGVESAPSLALLSAYLNRVQHVVREQFSAHPESGIAGSVSPAVESGGSDLEAHEGPVAIGGIRTRQDAIRALDAIAAFFRRNEPSSPVPLFLERAKRLVSKDFLEVLADVAPEAVTQAKIASGIRD